MQSLTDHTAGLAVFVGGKDRRQPVLVAWARDGEEAIWLEHAQASGYKRAVVLGTAIAMRDDVESFRARNQASNLFGFWFKRTDAFLTSMLAFKSAAMN